MRTHELRVTRNILIWVCLVYFQGSHSRSLHNALVTTNTSKETTQSSKEFINFVDGKCPPSVNLSSGTCEKFCSTDIDCTEDNKCCPNGCSMICVEPWFPKQVVDWGQTDQSPPNQLPRNPKEQGTETSLREPCSTSILDGMEPLRCPSQHYCFITMDEDTQSNIPNRGECIRKNQQGEKQLKTILKKGNNRPIYNNGCTHKGRRHNHQAKFQRDCSGCVCYNGVVFCENKPCPIKASSPSIPKRFHEDSSSGDTREQSGSGDVLKDHSGSTSVDEETSGDDQEQSGSGGAAEESGCEGGTGQCGSGSLKKLGSKKDEKDFRSYTEKELATIKPRSTAPTDFSFPKKTVHTECPRCNVESNKEKVNQTLNITKIKKENIIDESQKKFKNITKPQFKIILEKDLTNSKKNITKDLEKTNEGLLQKFSSVENVSRGETYFPSSKKDHLEVILLKPHRNTEDDIEGSSSGSGDESGSGTQDDSEDGVSGDKNWAKNVFTIESTGHEEDNKESLLKTIELQSTTEIEENGSGHLEEKIEASNSTSNYDQGSGEEKIETINSTSNYDQGSGEEKIGTNSTSNYDQGSGEEKIEASSSTSNYDQGSGGEKIETNSTSNYDQGSGEERNRYKAEYLETTDDED